MSNSRFQNNANFAAKKSHTSHQCGPIYAADTTEGACSFGGYNDACDLLLLIMKDLYLLIEISNLKFKISKGTDCLKTR